jgi:hypothetical protein
VERNEWPPRGAATREEVRRCPTLPQGPPCSTIGAERLSFRVRNGTGRFPLAMAAETLLMCLEPPSVERLVRFPTVHREPLSGREHRQHQSQTMCKSSYWLISTGQLHGSFVPTSTSGLSTQCSSWEPLARRHGNLILRPASRLDAFSGYPSRT